MHAVYANLKVGSFPTSSCIFIALVIKIILFLSVSFWHYGTGDWHFKIKKNTYTGLKTVELGNICFIFGCSPDNRSKRNTPPRLAYRKRDSIIYTWHIFSGMCTTRSCCSASHCNIVLTLFDLYPSTLVCQILRLGSVDMVNLSHFTTLISCVPKGLSIYRHPSYVRDIRVLSTDKIACSYRTECIK